MPVNLFVAGRSTNKEVGPLATCTYGMLRYRIAQGGLRVDCQFTVPKMQYKRTTCCFDDLTGM